MGAIGRTGVAWFGAGAWLVVLAALLGVPSASGGVGDGGGGSDGGARSVFFEGGYEGARVAAAEGDRLLVLYFTASWCGPCKQMERTTWVDERVVGLLTTRGVVLKVDVDEQPELAGKYAVRAMPTLVALRDGEVFDRVLGARTPEQMIEWFDGVRRGERSIDVQRRELEALRPGEHDVQGRFRFAQALIGARAFGEATTHLLWLWDHGVEHDPSFGGVRSSFMHSSIGELCREHAPAAEAFGERRDAAERRMLEGGLDVRLAEDFAALNDVLGEGERTLAWFDAGKDDAAKASLFEAAGAWLTPLLLSSERWADAGRMLTSPVERAQGWLPQQVSMVQQLGDLDEESKGMLLLQFATRLSNEHAALLAAGREREANRMAMLVANQLGTAGRVELARAALRAKVVQPIHLRLIGSIDGDRPADLVELRSRVEAALAERDAG